MTRQVEFGDRVGRLDGVVNLGRGGRTGYVGREGRLWCCSVRVLVLWKGMVLYAGEPRDSVGWVLENNKYKLLMAADRYSGTRRVRR